MLSHYLPAAAALYEKIYVYKRRLDQKPKRIDSSASLIFPCASTLLLLFPPGDESDGRGGQISAAKITRARRRRTPAKN